MAEGARKRGAFVGQAEPRANTIGHEMETLKAIGPLEPKSECWQPVSVGARARRAFGHEKPANVEPNSTCCNHPKPVDPPAGVGRAVGRLSLQMQFARIYRPRRQWKHDDTSARSWRVFVWPAAATRIPPARPATFRRHWQANSPAPYVELARRARQPTRKRGG